MPANRLHTIFKKLINGLLIAVRVSLILLDALFCIDVYNHHLFFSG